MAWIIGDSFDFYTGLSDLSGLWDTPGSTTDWAVSASGRFSGSQALSNGSGLANNLGPSKSSGSNDPTHHIVFAANWAGALSGTSLVTYITFFDVATAQCSIVFRTDGAILLTSGGPTGTVLATYASAFAANAWNAFEFEITINNTTGAFHVRKNGNTVDDFVATGLNTRPGTNSYANKIQFGNQVAVSGNSHRIDDFLWFSTSGAAPNTWVGDVRAVQLMPNADTTQKQFAPSPANFLAQQSTSTAGTLAATANNARWSPVTAPATGVSPSLQATLSVGATGNAIMALYDSSGAGGGPGTLISTTSVVVNPVAGVNAFAFTSPPSVVSGTPYWVGLLSDVSLSVLGISGNGHVDTLAVSYASGFPSSAAGFSTSVGVIGFTAIGMNVTPTNAFMVSEAQEDGDTTYVFDSTVGHNDLYNLADLPTPPLTVVAVQTRGWVRKSDAGARAAQVQMKSGATTVTSTALLLSTSYQYTSRVDTVDPNTSAAWSGTAINAIQVGPVVQA